MQIDRKVKRATRELLSSAGRGEPEELSEAIKGVGDNQRLLDCVGLCVRLAGYIAVDVLGPEWPTDAGLHRMAENAVKAENKYDLDVESVYDFLKRSAVGFQTVEHIFSNTEDMLLWPIVMTSSLLLTYRPRDKHVGEYLDDIEGALEAAESAKPSVYPAMILAAHRREASRER